jgi:hypothetical protein
MWLYFLPGQSTTFNELVSNCSWDKAKGNSEPNCWKGDFQSWYIIGFINFLCSFVQIFIFLLQFPLSDFVVMLFHYDGVVDEWRDLSWSNSAIHVSAVNQTKWWAWFIPSWCCLESQMELVMCTETGTYLLTCIPGLNFCFHALVHVDVHVFIYAWSMPSHNMHP